MPCPEQIKEYRFNDAVPILTALKKLLQDFLVKSLPSSPLGKAISYTLKRWEKLCLYTTDGKLQIDNNLVENSIRPVALGRKNYLFAGSHERAQDAAMLYSLFATCRLHGVNPEKWLTHLFEKINVTAKNDLHLLAAAKLHCRSLITMMGFVKGIRFIPSSFSCFTMGFGIKGNFSY